MSPNVQSSNITKLLSKLGFGPEPSQRPKKLLVDLIRKVDFQSLQLGNPMPLSRAHSPQAMALAQDFCESVSRASMLWPDVTNGAWPCWSRDRATIIEAVAHILSLKAFHKYQRDLHEAKAKRRRRDETETESELSSLCSDDLLEPVTMETSKSWVFYKDRATRQFVPSRTASSTQPTPKDPFTENCIHELERTKPSAYKSNYTWITSEWLRSHDPKFPAHIEQRILHYMHSNNFYDTSKDNGESNELTKQLRGDTVIDGLAFNTIRYRALERVKSLATELWEKGLLVNSTGSDFRTTKSPLFKEHWKQRNSIWHPQSANTATSVQQVVEDIDRRSQDCDKTPSQTTRKRHSPTNDVNITVSSLRSNGCNEGIVAYNDGTSPATKRVRTAQRSESRYRATPRTETETASPRLQSSQRTPRKSYVATIESDDDSPKFTPSTKEPQGAPASQDYGDTPAPLSTNATPSAEASLPTIAAAAIAFTNAPPKPTTQPEVLSSTSSSSKQLPQQESRADAAEHPNSTTAPIPENGQAPKLPAPESSGQPNKDHSVANTSKQDEGMSQPTAKSSPAKKTSSDEPGIVFILQKANLGHDHANPVPASELRSLTIPELFAFVAERSGAAIDELQCLTFMVSFAMCEDMLLQKNCTEEDWRTLKNVIGSKFRYARRKENRRTLFEVFVDLGDTTGGAKLDITELEGF